MVLAFGKHRICISVSVVCFLCPALESRIPLKRSQLRSSFQPLCVSTFTSPTPPWPSCHPLMSCFQSFYRPTLTPTRAISPPFNVLLPILLPPHHHHHHLSLSHSLPPHYIPKDMIISLPPS